MYVNCIQEHIPGQPHSIIMGSLRGAMLPVWYAQKLSRTSFHEGVIIGCTGPIIELNAVSWKAAYFAWTSRSVLLAFCCCNSFPYVKALIQRQCSVSYQHLHKIFSNSIPRLIALQSVLASNVLKRIAYCAELVSSPVRNIRDQGPLPVRRRAPYWIKRSSPLPPGSTFSTHP